MHIKKPIRGELVLSAFTVFKYLFSAVLIVVCFSVRKNSWSFAISFLELLIVIAVSNELMKRSKWFLIIHFLLALLLNIQVGVVLFAGSRLSMLLLSNVDMAFDLAGLAVLYIGAAALVVAISLLPVRPFRKDGIIPGYRGLAVLLAIELVFTLAVGNEYSPLYGYVHLIQEFSEYSLLKSELKASEENYAWFYREDICDARPKDSRWEEQPNVILIFAEGLSRHILRDPRELMPNLADLEKKSIHFEKYYNHTFATYRGLIGQLYSGYQMDNYDRNHLVSLQSILQDRGYHTCLINTEPHNYTFTEYLQDLGFQEFVSDPAKSYEGLLDTLSDREAFQLLFDTVSRLAEADSPFFTVIYTMGTHMTFDSEEKYGDGHNAELNKFWNLDRQFGRFMEQFLNSPVSDNTVLIFTTDHAAYADGPYTSTFDDCYTRDHAGLDEIPLFIYYNGVNPEAIDVSGRNTLDLAPTLCDLLDISAPNYFMGISLFYSAAEENGIFYDTIFYDTFSVASSKGGTVSPLSPSDHVFFEDTVRRYFSIARQKNAQ